MLSISNPLIYVRWHRRYKIYVPHNSEKYIRYYFLGTNISIKSSKSFWYIYINHKNISWLWCAYSKRDWRRVSSEENKWWQPHPTTETSLYGEPLANGFCYPPSRYITCFAKWIGFKEIQRTNTSFVICVVLNSNYLEYFLSIISLITPARKQMSPIRNQPILARERSSRFVLWLFE